MNNGSLADGGIIGRIEEQFNFWFVKNDCSPF